MRLTRFALRAVLYLGAHRGGRVPSAALADALTEARRAFFEALDRHTLADLLARTRPRLVAIGVDAAVDA